MGAPSFSHCSDSLASTRCALNFGRLATSSWLSPICSRRALNRLPTGSLKSGFWMGSMAFSVALRGAGNGVFQLEGGLAPRLVHHLPLQLAAGGVDVVAAGAPDHG